MEKPSFSSLEEITRSLSSACNVPVAVFDAAGNLEYSSSDTQEDLKWLRSLLSNPKVGPRYALPNGLLLRSESRQLGFFFEKKGIKIPSKVKHYIEYNWNTLEGFLTRNESEEILPPNPRELAFAKKLKPWIGFDRFFIFSQDSMRNSIFRNSSEHLLISRLSGKPRSFLNRITNTSSAITGKSSTFESFQQHYFLFIPGFSFKRSRGFICLRNKPFSTKEKRLADMFRLAEGHDEKHDLHDAVQLVDFLFYAFMHQNNPVQFYSFLLSRLKEFLRTEALALVWVENLEGQTTLGKASTGEWENQEAFFRELDSEFKKVVEKNNLGSTKSPLGQMIHAADATLPVNAVDFLPKSFEGHLDSIKSIPLEDRGKVEGLLFLNTNGQEPLKGKDLTGKWGHLSQTLARLLKSTLYDSQRELQFIQIGNSYSNLLEDFSQLSETQKRLEQELEGCRLVNTQVDQVFRFWQTFRGRLPDKHYLEALFRLLRSISGFEVIGRAKLTNGMFHLMFSMEEGESSQLKFQEMDGGLYHDLLFIREPHYWDGTWPRKFELPSGHPIVENGYFLPFTNSDGDDGILILANHSKGILRSSTQNFLRKILALESDFLLKAETF